METYPRSLFWKDAQKQYERLLFEEKTKSGKVSDYEQFLRDYPATHYRNEAEQFIYFRKTFDHVAEKYIWFIKEYPQSPLVRRAADYLYYIQKKSDTINWALLDSLHPDIDSLRSAAQIEALPLIPMLSEDRFIFFTAYGDTLKALNAQSIDPKYKCGKVIDEWLRIKTQNIWEIVNRRGFVLTSNATKIEYLSKELFLVYDLKGAHLYHCSGVKISTSPVQQAKDLNGFIAFQSTDKWGIMTYSGLELVAATLDDISSLGSFFILEDNERYTVINSATLNPDQSLPEFTFPFDDFELITDSLILGLDKDQEGLLDHNLATLIPIAKHEIYASNTIWYTKTDSTYQVFDKINLEPIAPAFSDLSVNEQWLAMKRGAKWTLRALKDSVSSILTPLDSVVLLNRNVSYIERRDSTFLFFQNGLTYPLAQNSSFIILRSLDEKKSDQSFVVYSSKGKKTVLDRNGKLIFDGRYEDIQYLDDSTFIVKSRNKYGIYHSRKGLIVKPFYDQITEKKEIAYLLKGNLIGLLDLKSGVILPPEFTAKPQKFLNGFLVNKGEKIGVILNAKTWLIPLEYEEIKHWNDTSFWSKADGLWSLKTISGEVIIKNVITIKNWESKISSGYLLFMKDDKFGIVSPTKGLLVPPVYNDIINIGTSEIPIFFAEQHLKTAAFYVVTYFDPNGHVIKSQAYRPHEYDRVYCDN